jgi:hypothetical protein
MNVGIGTERIYKASIEEFKRRMIDPTFMPNETPSSATKKIYFGGVEGGTE